MWPVSLFFLKESIYIYIYIIFSYVFRYIHIYLSIYLSVTVCLNYCVEITVKIWEQAPENILYFSDHWKREYIEDTVYTVVRRSLKRKVQIYQNGTWNDPSSATINVRVKYTLCKRRRRYSPLSPTGQDFTQGQWLEGRFIVDLVVEARAPLDYFGHRLT